MKPEQFSLPRWAGKDDIMVYSGHDLIAFCKECTDRDVDLLTALLYMLMGDPRDIPKCISGNSYRMLVCKDNQIYELDFRTFWES